MYKYDRVRTGPKATPLPKPVNRAGRLTPREINRAANLKKLARDPIDLALKLDLSLVQLRSLYDREAPITDEMITFIEGRLHLDSGSLDANPQISEMADSGNSAYFAQSAAVPAVENGAVTAVPVRVRRRRTFEVQGAIPQGTEVAISPSPPSPETVPVPIVPSLASLLEVRLKQTDALCALARGIRSELCKRLGRADNLFSLMRKMRVRFDDTLARNIESILGVPNGWLDQDGPHPEQMAPWVMEKIHPHLHRDHSVIAAPSKRGRGRPRKSGPPALTKPIHAASAVITSSAEADIKANTDASPSKSGASHIVGVMVDMVSTRAREGLITDKVALQILNVLIDHVA